MLVSKSHNGESLYGLNRKRNGWDPQLSLPHHCPDSSLCDLWITHTLPGFILKSLDYITELPFDS